MSGGGPMRLDPDRLWRGFGTALFLSLIGLGGTVMAVTVFPVINLLTRAADVRQRRILYAMHLAFRLYCAAIKLLRVADIDIKGGERLRHLQGALIVANHPSLLDVVMIIAATPRVQCIVKAGLWRHPLYRLTVGGAGFLRNDLEPEDLVAASTRDLHAGLNLIIFPEGTRTIPGTRPKLHRGFANLAITAGCPVQVLTITCDPPVLHKGNPWWRVPEKRSRFCLEVGELLDIGRFTDGLIRSVAARRLVAYLDNFYLEKLGHGHAGTALEDIDRRCVEAGGSVA